MAEVMKGCKATRSDGEPCRAPAQEGKNWCFFHDPNQAEARITASRSGGKARKRRPAAIPRAEKLEPEEAREILAGAIEAAINGALDVATARTVGYLLQVEAKIRDGGEMEKRVRLLEEILKREKAPAKL
jgi:hypothetical protein